MKAAVAGLVPCADSGTSTTERLEPFASCAALIASMPHNSPCAPAFGLIATECMPVSSSRYPASASINCRAPCTVDCGCSGWISPKPGSRAIFSLSRALCFIVHEPSG